MEKLILKIIGLVALAITLLQFSFYAFNFISPWVGICVGIADLILVYILGRSIAKGIINRKKKNDEKNN
jgi:sorbitol-specific phosphotransferase system component IIBC